MDDEHLIECVRQYEVLYDLSNSKYMDTSYKNEIWSKIAEQLKSDGKLYLKKKCLYYISRILFMKPIGYNIPITIQYLYI